MRTNISEAVLMALRGEQIGFCEYLLISRLRVDEGIDRISEIDGAAVVKHHVDNRWQMILPDVSGNGRWRTQSFDGHGFSGHRVFDTKDLAIRSAASSQFTVRDDEALNRIQETPEFKSGLYATEQIGLFNRGEIDLKEYTRRVLSNREKSTDDPMH
jgi:hypothetical protein